MNTIDSLFNNNTININNKDNNDNNKKNKINKLNFLYMNTDFLKNKENYLYGTTNKFVGKRLKTYQTKNNVFLPNLAERIKDSRPRYQRQTNGFILA